MPHSDDCPCGRSQLFTFNPENSKRVFSLVMQSVDALANIRHREVFLECLNTYLVEARPDEFDDSYCFRASLLLDSYYEYVPASLALVELHLQKALQLMREGKHG